MDRDHTCGADNAVDQAEMLADQCRALFAGLDPGLQGPALAELLATWIAGHRPEVRERIFVIHLEGVRALIPHVDPWPPKGRLNG
jgi:hypothetical protein